MRSFILIIRHQDFRIIKGLCHLSISPMSCYNEHYPLSFLSEILPAQFALKLAGTTLYFPPVKLLL
jgi:hypothetical protein